MTIEEHLVRDFGKTTEPTFGTWMLRDGSMVNGSIEGFRRDVDHHEIQHYFKRSKFETPGSSYIYIQKFLRRGNIRMKCNNICFGLELMKTPSEKQLATIRHICRIALHRGTPAIIDWHVGEKIHSGRPDEYMEYLKRYTNLGQTSHN